MRNQKDVQPKKASHTKNNQRSSSYPSKSSLKSYRQSTRSYIRGAIDRLEKIDRPGTIEDLFDQMMIVHAISKPATTNRIRASVRHVFSEILSNGDVNSGSDSTFVGVALEEEIEMHVPEWVENLTKEDLRKYLEWMSLGRKSLISQEGWRATRALEEWRSISGDSPEIVGDDDVLKSLSGLKSSSKVVAKSKSWTPITREIMTRIDLAMPDDMDPRAVLRFIRNGRRLKNTTIARIAMWGCWLTGMRPAEMKNTVLLVPTKESPPLDMETPDFSEISRTGYVPAENSLAKSGKTIDAALDLISSVKRGLDRPVLFRIDNLKTATAPDAKPFRIIDVTQMPDIDIVRLLHVSLLRHSVNMQGERSSWVANAGRIVKDASLHPMIGMRGMHVSLGLLRHNFIETARVSRTVEEVSAIVGHTSLRTTRGYGSGEAHLFRSGTGRSGLPIVPAADPMRVAELKSGWNRKSAEIKQKANLDKTSGDKSMSDDLSEANLDTPEKNT